MPTDTTSPNARSWELAEIALHQIKSLDLAAGPESFELWFTYASGVNAPLNNAINDLLSQQGHLSEPDINRLFEMFLSSRRFVQRLCAISDQLSGEIAQVEKNIAASITSANALNTEIGGSFADLDKKKSQDELGMLVEALVASTKEFQRVNSVQLGQLQEAESRAASLQQSVNEIRQESVTDALTSLANRRHFDTSILAAVVTAEKSGAPLALLFCDIDRFKSLNDQFGHRVGDQVLRKIAEVIKQNLRHGDIGARYGGEELVAILPDTPLTAAKNIGERIRTAIERTSFVRRGTGEKLPPVTISVGIATFQVGDTADQMIERADACLYAAKNAGRNRTICETDIETITNKSAF